MSEFWFQLADAVGNPVIDPSFVILDPQNASVMHLQKQIIQDHPETLAGVEASRLGVYRRRSDFPSGQLMRTFDSIKVNAREMDDFYWVVVRPRAVAAIRTSMCAIMFGDLFTYVVGHPDDIKLFINGILEPMKEQLADFKRVPFPGGYHTTPTGMRVPIINGNPNMHFYGLERVE